MRRALNYRSIKNKSKLLNKTLKNETKVTKGFVIYTCTNHAFKTFESRTTSIISMYHIHEYHVCEDQLSKQQPNVYDASLVDCSRRLALDAQL